MPRYTSQRRKMDCGPAALINLMKWAGYGATYRKHGDFLNLMCRPEGYGTSVSRLQAALAHLKKNRFWFKYRPRARLLEIEDHLRKGGAVILLYFTGTNYHFTLITDVTDSGSRFTVVNAFTQSTVGTVSRSRLKKWLRWAPTSQWLVHRYSSEARAAR